MKQSSTFILKVVLFLLGATVIGLCIFVLPKGLQGGGGVYFPIIIGMYIAAVPFFIALWGALKILTNIDKNNVFSESSIKALRYIKYCAIAISSLYTAGIPFIIIAANKDDAPGVLAIGLVIIFASIVIAVFAGVLQKLIQNAIDIKAENDLTV